jgi:stalled ribosome rescue protein Dom34
LKDLGYTGEFGLHELVEKSADLLKEEEVTEAKAAVNKLLEMLRKDPDKVAYGKKQVKEALDAGAVEKLLLSDSLSEEELEAYQDAADVRGTDLQVIPVDIREGAQLRDLGGVAAILRYALR